MLRFKDAREKSLRKYRCLRLIEQTLKLNIKKKEKNSMLIFKLTKEKAQNI